MIIIFILVISILSTIITISKAATDCIGGYEGPDASGLCTECPAGKVSGSAERKQYDGTTSCLPLAVTCGPGQYAYQQYNSFYCQNAELGSYCPNGKCFRRYQWSSDGPLGVSSCPYGEYTEASTNYDWTLLPPQISSLFASMGYGTGAVICTASDTQFCPSGAGSLGSGVVIKGDTTYKGASIGDRSFRSFFYPTTSNPAGCYSCTAGTYQSGRSSTGSLNCALCPEGKYSPAVASECVSSACPGGFGYSTVVYPFFTSEERACKPCAAGYYSDGGHLECQECPRKLTSNYL